MSIGGDIATAVVAGGLAFGGSMYAGRRELKKLKAERFNQRERDFENAQDGYRACYRKFLVNVAVFHAQTRDKQDEDEKNGDQKEKKGKKVTLDTLIDNAWEAAFVSDPRVVRELENYWPAEDRARRQPPGEEPPKTLVDAMLAHGGRSLKEHLKLVTQAEEAAEQNANGENAIKPAAS